MSIVAEKQAATERLTLDKLTHLPTGKRARLHTLMYGHGPGNGSIMVLPIDQGLEHGPINWFENEAAANPNYQLEIAKRGNYSAIAFHYGLADKYLRNFAGEVPLILKLNGKTNVPSDAEALSPLVSTVEDACRLGASAIGYTLYVGSPNQVADIKQFQEVRRECDRLGMPIVMWAYPRGRDIEAKGGKDCPYAIEYAARVACEVGADVVKVNFPNVDAPEQGKSPKPFNEKRFEFQESCERIVRSAGQTLLIWSGGSKIADDALLHNVRTGVAAGGVGTIFGRNIWMRSMDDALALSSQVSGILRSANG
ncbi:MAG: class I fructose-bisphosphate aldolase [Vampirovibrionales bacterium]